MAQIRIMRFGRKNDRYGDLEVVVTVSRDTLYSNSDIYCLNPNR